MLLLIITVNTAFLDDSSSDYVQTSLTRNTYPFSSLSNILSSTTASNIPTTQTTPPIITSHNTERPNGNYGCDDDPDVAATKNLEVWIVSTKVRDSSLLKQCRLTHMSSTPLEIEANIYCT